MKREDICDMNRLYREICSKIIDRELFLTAGLTVEDIAREVNSNRTYVTRAIRCRCITFPQLVNSIRAAYAIDLIRDGKCRDVSVLDIALMSGFNSVRTMNRYVRKSAGETAHALRLRLFGPVFPQEVLRK